MQKKNNEKWVTNWGCTINIIGLGLNVELLCEKTKKMGKDEEKEKEEEEEEEEKEEEEQQQQQQHQQ
jgi:hypothetical protein